VLALGRVRFGMLCRIEHGTKGRSQQAGRTQTIRCIHRKRSIAIRAGGTCCFQDIAHEFRALTEDSHTSELTGIPGSQRKIFGSVGSFMMNSSVGSKEQARNHIPKRTSGFPAGHEKEPVSLERLTYFISGLFLRNYLPPYFTDTALNKCRISSSTS